MLFSYALLVPLCSSLSAHATGKQLTIRSLCIKGNLVNYMTGSKFSSVLKPGEVVGNTQKGCKILKDRETSPTEIEWSRKASLDKEVCERLLETGITIEPNTPVATDTCHYTFSGVGVSRPFSVKLLFSDNGALNVGESQTIFDRSKTCASYGVQLRGCDAKDCKVFYKAVELQVPFDKIGDGLLDFINGKAKSELCKMKEPRNFTVDGKIVAYMMSNQVPAKNASPIPECRLTFYKKGETTSYTVPYDQLVYADGTGDILVDDTLKTATNKIGKIINLDWCKKGSLVSFYRDGEPEQLKVLTSASVKLDAFETWFTIKCVFDNRESISILHPLSTICEMMVEAYKRLCNFCPHTDEIQATEVSGKCKFTYEGGSRTVAPKYSSNTGEFDASGSSGAVHLALLTSPDDANDSTAPSPVVKKRGSR